MEQCPMPKRMANAQNNNQCLEKYPAFRVFIHWNLFEIWDLVNWELFRIILFQVNIRSQI